MTSPESGRQNQEAARSNVFFNLVLMVAKLGVGIIGQSQALIADGLHSGADVLSSIAVVIGLAVAGRPPDSGHHYGHAKAEAISQKVVAVFLLLAGLEVANSAIQGLSHPGARPSWMTFGVAVAAMVPKVFMAVSQRRLAKRTGSHGILASAVDNQMDAVSSFVAALGIVATHVGFRVGDSLAALIVAVLVMWAGVDVFRTAALDLMDPAADSDTELEIRQTALGCPGVRRITTMRTRVSGTEVRADLEIEVDRDLSLVAAHEIAHTVEDAVMGLDRVRGVTVHVNPAQEGDMA